MTAAALLREARTAGLRLKVEGQEIALSAAEAPSPELLAHLRAHKADLLELLTKPHWTDDRTWIADVLRAPDEAAKLSVVAAWVTAYGGETCGRSVMIPALRPHRERRLAELELRRMCRQLGLEVLEEEV